MSDTSLTDRIDTDELASSIDYEELLEGTELGENLDFGDDKSTAEALGGAIGAAIGRRLGEMIAKQIQESIKETVSREDEEEDEEGEDAEEDEEGEEEEGEEKSEVDEIPQSAEELADLSYRQLQSLAMEHDVQANLSREELTQELSETFGI